MYSEIKLTWYVNFVFPAMIFRSSAWKNTRQSKSFPASQVLMSMKICTGKLKRTAVKKSYDWFGLRLHSARESEPFCTFRPQPKVNGTNGIIKE